MKNLICLISLISSITSLNAFAFDETYPVVTCGGDYSVTLTAGGFTGATIASVTDLTGARQLASYVVTGNNQGMQRTYSADGFELVIMLESFAPTVTHPSTLFFRENRQGGTDSHAARLTCTIKH